MAGGRVRVICGPTAGGKSDIAMRLALEYGAMIVSADSRQVYRGFDIGTAKPTHGETRRVPHRGVDVAEPIERYSSSMWATAAMEWVAESHALHLAPLIVGGTGLYIRALFDPFFDAPRVDPEKRALLERYMERMAIAELRRWCAVLDPEKARLGRVQLCRAIETALLVGRRLSELQRRSQSERKANSSAASLSDVRPHYLVVDPGLALSERICRRVDRMLDAGWVDEVRSLMAHVPDNAPAWKASGYRVVRAFAGGSTDLSATRERIIIETRQYAKRQRTWFRHQLGAASVTRVDPEAPGCGAAVERWWKELT